MRFTRTAILTSAALIGLAILATAPATADQVFLDDVIIDGSACVGFDCVNGESFGFDTIRIKENNLRIRAQDTSTSASFPTNDWQITFNDTSNGGANKFAIDDIDGGRTPFTIEAGAPSHSLYVEDGGRIGFGTSTPVVELHIKDGDSPTLRLEQDGTSGFTPQTWDVAGNEANFFVRDVTNGSRLPFKIIPGAPTDALRIDTSGVVRVGGDNSNVLVPVADLSLLVGEHTNGGAARLGLQTDGIDYAIVADGTSAGGAGEFIFASTTVPSGLFSLRGDGLSPGVGAGTALCVSGGNNTLCICGACP